MFLSYALGVYVGGMLKNQALESRGTRPAWIVENTEGRLQK